jgi:hypothetical protein
MMRKIQSKWIWLLLFLLSGTAGAQTFNYNADLDSVDQSGFYAFSITPELSSMLKTDFRDLRIKDNAGNPVPWLAASNLPVLRPDLLRALDIVQNTTTDSGQSVLIIRNDPKDKIDGFYIRFRNAAVSRTINLSGSHDGVKWYTIIENVSLERRFIQDRDSFLENISFPLSSYTFYRVIIYNGKNDPLDILSVQKRISRESPVPHALIQNPAVSFIRNDSSKISWIKIANPRRFHISHLSIQVKAPRFFKRQVDILVNDFLIGNFTISSDSLIHFSLPMLNDSLIKIQIYNEDNPPLDISAITTAQDAEQIIAYLDSGKSYQLDMMSADAQPPRYDLVNFKDSIPENIKQIGVSNIVPVPALRTVAPLVLFKNSWLWLTLAIVLIVLALFTIRLTKEVGKHGR